MQWNNYWGSWSCGSIDWKRMQWREVYTARTGKRGSDGKEVLCEIQDRLHD